MWVRGLKLYLVRHAALRRLSHPVWVRGLKRDGDNRTGKTTGVAPRVGAWIETWRHEPLSTPRLVAPRVGAWIETPGAPLFRPDGMSHPVWVRGLKLEQHHHLVARRASHPVWVRGLKPQTSYLIFVRIESHPVWVRGLKHRSRCLTIQPHHVAPRVGAWIETKKSAQGEYFNKSHPVWVRGLKQHRLNVVITPFSVAPRVGAWIETPSAERHVVRRSVAPRVGAWIETQLVLLRRLRVTRRTPCGCVD